MNIVWAPMHQISLTCVLVCLWGCTTDTQKSDTAVARQANAPGPDIQIKNPRPYPFRFVAYGDMRFAENESYDGKVIANADARRQVIDQIANESPEFLVVTGDFVFRGFHVEDWTYWDRAIKPMKDRGVPVFPSIGNHEVGPFPPKIWGGKAFQEIAAVTEQLIASKGLANYYKEFPEIPRNPWYSVRYANCYFLVLDSEVDDAAQDGWIKVQLEAIPPEIDYIFIALHRPPYTALDDEVHKPREMQLKLRKALEERQQSSRAHIIVIAGHVHNYERYQHNGVTYIVSGGGGAAPVKFARSAEDLYPQNALYGKNDPANEDQYHYCLFTVDHSKLTFQMMKLVSKGKRASFEPRDSLEVNVGAH